MFTTDSSTGSGARPDVVSSDRVAHVVPLSQAAPAAPPVPPQNLEAEESVLGAMMLSPGAIGAVSEIVDASHFYYQKHGRIYRAALNLYASGVPVDAISVADELDKRGELEEVGGRTRVYEIASLVPASANAAHHASIVREMAVLRGLIRVGSQISGLGWERDGDSSELLARAEELVYDLSEARTADNLVPFREALLETFARISELYESGEEVNGVPSGFKALDRVTAGFQSGNLIILAARPSMGKSALGLSIVANVVLREQRPCAFFSLEMSRQEVAQRLMCMEAKIDSHAIRTGRLSPTDWPKLISVCDPLEKAPLYVDDTAGLNLLELRSRLQTLKRREQNLSLVVVDYMQLMTTASPAESRLQEVSAISRGLKEIARDLDLPIIALSQLSRAVEQRTDKRPVLSDLRESGSIEQDADIVMFIYRDDYYNKNSDSPGIAEISVAKNRHGPTDSVNLAFLGSSAKFSSVHN